MEERTWPPVTAVELLERTADSLLRLLWVPEEERVLCDTLEERVLCDTLEERLLCELDEERVLCDTLEERLLCVPEEERVLWPEDRLLWVPEDRVLWLEDRVLWLEERLLWVEPVFRLLLLDDRVWATRSAPARRDRARVREVASVINLLIVYRFFRLSGGFKA